MTKLTSAFGTWHFWILIGTFAVGGIGALSGAVSPGVAGTLTSVATFINLLIHVNSQPTA